MGLVHSSAAETLIQFLLNHLKQADEIQSGISPNFLVRNWSPAFTEWSTRAIRDAFYASPTFPRLLNANAIKETIARGVQAGIVAYVAKGANSKYQPFLFEKTVAAEDIEISDETFLVTQETARAYLLALEKDVVKPPLAQPPMDSQSVDQDRLPVPDPEPAQPPPPPSKSRPHAGFKWSGDVPAQKWMNFYTKVLAKYATSGGLTLKLEVSVTPAAGVTQQQLEEVKAALRELGLSDKLD
jgi:hypothetical protein